MYLRAQVVAAKSLAAETPFDFLICASKLAFEAIKRLMFYLVKFSAQGKVRRRHRESFS